MGNAASNAPIVRRRDRDEASQPPRLYDTCLWQDKQVLKLVAKGSLCPRLAAIEVSGEAFFLTSLRPFHLSPEHVILTPPCAANEQRHTHS